MGIGPCRSPLGQGDQEGARRDDCGSLRRVWGQTNPEVLEPIERAFDVSIAKRLQLPQYWEGLL